MIDTDRAYENVRFDINRHRFVRIIEYRLTYVVCSGECLYYDSALTTISRQVLSRAYCGRNFIKVDALDDMEEQGFVERDDNGAWKAVDPKP